MVRKLLLAVFLAALVLIVASCATNPSLMPIQVKFGRSHRNSARFIEAKPPWNKRIKVPGAVESRLRIVHNRSLDELPENMDDLEKLARRLGCEATADHTAGQIFLQVLEWHTSQTRSLFKEIFQRERMS